MIAHTARALHVAIASGGTAGHVHPALAVADAWRALRPDVELTFLGTPQGFADRVAPHRFVSVPAAPLAGSGTFGKVQALATALRGAVVARRALAASRPRLLLAFGNYASAGAVLGARSLGIPVVLHEANVVPGIANRWLEGFSTRILVGFGGTRAAFPAGKAVVTGTPVRAELSAITKTPPVAGRPLRLLVTGGSLGSRFLDAHAPELAARARCLVRHQAADPIPVGDAYRRLAVQAEVVRYLDSMADAYAWADVALTCAGAMTLAELAIVGLPAVVVPLACAALDHQTANAREAAGVTGCLSVAESAWDAGVVAAHLDGLARSPDAWSAASAGMRRLAAPDAARRIVEACEELIEG